MIKFLLRFSGWWAAISSLAAMGSACPCCNSVVCPQATAIWGMLGALCACFLRVKPQIVAPEESSFTRHDFTLRPPDHKALQEPVPTS